MTLALVAAGYLMWVNYTAYRAFEQDKHAARRNHQRVPEATLLRHALIGGWPGAKLAQRQLRHKTTKQPFGRRLNLIGALQAVLIVAVVILLWATAPADDPTPAPARDAAPAAAPADAPPAQSRRPPAGRPAAQ